MRKFSHLLIVICLVLFVSCKKYLDEPTTTNVGYPNTIANCQALLDNAGVMNIGRTPGFLDASCDDYFLTMSQFNSQGQIDRDAYLWKEPNIQSENDWRNSYAPVYQANVCLENIDDIDKSTSVSAWNNVKGSALFFRAYFFSQLVWTYSKAYDEISSATDLGISIKLSSDLYDPTTRASVLQTYNQIIDDAKHSLKYLPDTSNHPLRPSKVASFGLLARIYLSMRMYDSAAKYADGYLGLKNKLIDYNGDPDIVNSFGLDISPFRQYNSETAFYSSAFKAFAVPGIFSSYVDTTLYASYDADDLRKVAFFSGGGTYKAFKGSYTQDISSRFSGIATDEMYLIRAECHARNGNKNEALSDLNMLLVKRWRTGTFIPITAPDAQQALVFILKERRKELLMRGIRWADLKRLNKESANATTILRVVDNQPYTLPPNDNKYALPIPFQIIQTSGMQQNPR